MIFDLSLNCLPQIAIQVKYGEHVFQATMESDPGYKATVYVLQLSSHFSIITHRIYRLLSVISSINQSAHIRSLARVTPNDFITLSIGFITPSPLPYIIFLLYFMLSPPILGQ